MRITSWALMLSSALPLLCGCQTAPTSNAERESLIVESASVLRRLKADDPSLQRFLSKAYGYAVFPEVGKGALIAGGAYGKGLLYEQGRMVGYVDVTQATVGLQAGGQSYSELIVFEQAHDVDRFISGKFALAANVSAVAINAGAARSAKYTEGVAVFVRPIGGLMLEAAVGGQQFTYMPK